MSSINVNLTPCTQNCSRIFPHPPSGGHWDFCAAARSVLVPLPLEPWRTVTLKVRLGECDCLSSLKIIGTHTGDCRSRLVRVICSITGKTWADSEVVDAWPEKNDGYLCSTTEAFPTLEAACRARWALVKALVLGYPNLFVPGGKAAADAVDLLRAQRDAVFVAIEKAYRAEDALIEALGDYEEAMRGRPVGIYGLKRESHGALERYVKNLIEQVGNLA